MRCRCRCHRTEVDAPNPEWPGVDTRNFAACAFACEVCRWLHKDVLKVGFERMPREPTRDPTENAPKPCDPNDPDKNNATPEDGN